MQGMIPIFAAFFIQTALGADLMLAQEYKDQDITGWAMSEKLDGVRAYWDGRQLVSRQGYAFTPPKGLPRSSRPIRSTASCIAGADSLNRFPPPCARLPAIGAASAFMFSMYPKRRAISTNASQSQRNG